METIVTYARPELLQVADTVARDKGIDRDEVLEAMEQAIQKAGRSKYGQEYDIRAEIDRRNGEIRLLRFREVADEVENEATQISHAEAQRLNPEAEVGDFITDPLPPIDFGRIAAQTAKQVIVQKVRDAERQRQFLEFRDRVSEVVNGLVKRVEFGNVVVDLGRAEAICAGTSSCRAKASARVSAFAHTSTMFGRNCGARRSFCPVLIRSLWPNCSRRRCRRFMTASSRSRQSLGIRAVAPKSR
jgi:hypothetical protein